MIEPDNTFQNPPAAATVEETGEAKRIMKTSIRSAITLADDVKEREAIFFSRARGSIKKIETKKILK